MKKIIFVLSALLSLLLLLLSGCVQETVVCNSPYIKVGNSCCLDSNNNKICDSDEGAFQNHSPKTANNSEDFNCSKCEPVVVERTVTKEITKYVCEKDNRVVNNSKDCLDFAANFHYNPIKTNEDNSNIEEFKIRPACRDSQHAGEIYFKTKSLTNKIVFQIKESPTGNWKEIYTYNGSHSEDYLYFAFCKYINCTYNADFYLQPNMKYLMRAKFYYEDSSKEKQYSNEWIIDSTGQGEFMKKLC